MVNKKDLIIAVLATFCLTAIIFMVTPIRSSTNPYDPWIDSNDDGKIGLQDLASLANSYGTTGDPTKNVTVTSMPFDVQYEMINFSNTGTGGAVTWNTVYSSSINGLYSNVFFCGGYSRIGIAMEPVNTSSGSYQVTFYLSFLDWWNGAEAWETVGSWVNMTVYANAGYHTQAAFLATTKAQYFTPWIDVLSTSSSMPAQWWILLKVYMYLRNE